MNKKDFYYKLPEELIAQDPIAVRSLSRLLVLHKEADNKILKLEHRKFTDIANYLQSGDCLVLNETKVIPARLFAVKKDTKARIEVLLLKRLSEDSWECLVKPGKKCRKNTELIFAEGILEGTVTEIGDGGNRIIQFKYSGIFEEVLDKLGRMPLPPYIKHELKDRNRYQTVYARNDGSAAAPTAGLHFTEELLEEIKAKGINIVKITLHVGLGTFRPVKEDDILKHHMHSEYYLVEEEAAKEINLARQNGKRIICVGTTVCRTLESAADASGTVHAGSGTTDIFIYPGYKFKLMDGLITNFHLPESTLIMLVSAFAGREKTLAAYEEAVNNRYRFFSFGDAMLII